MRRRLTVRDLEKLRLPSQPAISPDGERVVYVLRTTDVRADEDRCRLWLASAGDDAPVQLTRGDWDTAPAWSPAGTRIAFLRGGAGAPPQVWLLPADGGEPERLTARPLDG